MIIEDVLPLQNYHLLVISDDGRKGIVDMRPYLELEAFQPLKVTNEFMRIHNARYFVEWDCGADLSADSLEARWVAVEEQNIRVVQ